MKVVILPCPSGLYKVPSPPPSPSGPGGMNDFQKKIGKLFKRGGKREEKQGKRKKGNKNRGMMDTKKGNAKQKKKDFAVTILGN